MHYQWTLPRIVHALNRRKLYMFEYASRLTLHHTTGVRHTAWQFFLSSWMCVLCWSLSTANHSVRAVNALCMQWATDRTMLPSASRCFNILWRTPALTVNIRHFIVHLDFWQHSKIILQLWIKGLLSFIGHSKYKILWKKPLKKHHFEEKEKKRDRGFLTFSVGQKRAIISFFFLCLS